MASGAEAPLLPEGARPPPREAWRPAAGEAPRRPPRGGGWAGADAGARPPPLGPGVAEAPSVDEVLSLAARLGAADRRALQAALAAADGQHGVAKDAALGPPAAGAPAEQQAQSLWSCLTASLGVLRPASVGRACLRRFGLALAPAPEPEGQRGRTPSSGSRGRALQDPWERGDPWALAARGAAQRQTGAAGAPEQDAWSGYQATDRLGPPRAAAPAAGGAGAEGAPGKCAMTGCFFEEVCGMAREEYIKKHVDFQFQDVVRRMCLSDVDLFRLGRKHYQEQSDFLRRLSRDDEVLAKARLRESKGKGKGKGKGKEGPGRDWFWDDDEIEEQPFWWRGRAESLCFDLALTPEKELTTGAPPMYQWWDVEKLSESDNFVGVCKPAGMFVVTDHRGLWEVSPTNFIHVSHKRFEMPSGSEPRQRGICHRLDSHTSGVQIFGKSWEAFRHFTVQNSAHRMQKEYIALVCGRLGGPDMPGSGIIDVPLKKWQDFNRREFGSVICCTDGLPAVTKYRALRHWKVPAKGKFEFWGEDRWFTLVQMRILTGRTHQIRVHMAFLGHPLVGDVKYNPARVEQDAALVPRVFLHCLRMEFEDMDGSTFVAASDLASDLQVVLDRIQKACATPAAAGPRGAASPPGLAALLCRSAEAAPEDGGAVPAGASGEGVPPPRRIVHRCLNCMHWEEAWCSEVRRGKRAALSWRTQRFGGSPAEARAQQAGGAEDALFTSWGPRQLWVPTELRGNRREADEELAAQRAPAGSPQGSGAAAPAPAAPAGGGGCGTADAAPAPGPAPAGGSPARGPPAEAGALLGLEELQKAFPGAQLLLAPMQPARR